MATDEKLGKNMLFPLAERMVIKFVNEGKIEAEAGTCNVQYINADVWICFFSKGNTKDNSFCVKQS